MVSCLRQKDNKMARFLESECCLESYEAIITERGEWKLRCTKCGRECASAKNPALK